MSEEAPVPPAESRQAVDLGVDVGLHTGEDRPDAAPGDELGDRRLRVLNREPGHSVVESSRAARAVPAQGTSATTTP